MSVYRRGSVWWYNFTFHGVRYQASSGSSHKDVALQAEAKRKAELATSVSERPTRKTRSAVTFAEFVRREFEPWSAVEHGGRPSTHARYMRSIKALLEFFGNHPLTGITAGQVEKYKIFKSQQPRKKARDGRLVTPAAVNRDLATLRILFGYAARLGFVAKNPVSEVKLFRETARHMRVLSASEEQQYLAAASPLLRDVAILMLDTGMRPGEIYGLKKEDVDLDLKSVFVRSGKTANATRFIPLTERSLNVLARRVDELTTGWLFPCPFRPSCHIQDVRKAHDGAVERSEVTPRFRLYDLRHTALSRMAMSGMDLPTLKEIAGHSQIQMTMRYVHPTPEHKRRAIVQYSNFMDQQSLATK